MKKLFIGFIFTVLYVQLEGAAQPQKAIKCCEACRPRWIIIDNNKKPELPKKPGDTLPLHGEQTSLRRMIAEIHNRESNVDLSEEEIAQLLVKASPRLFEKQIQARAERKAQRSAFGIGVISGCMLFASVFGLLYR